MDFILSLYSDLPNTEKDIFKEILNDIILMLSEYEKNKWKKSIKQRKQEEITKKSITILNETLKKEGFNEDDINVKEMFEDIFWSKEIEENSVLFFPIYKWVINSKNNNIFTFRRDIINILNKEWLIKISDLNIIKELNLLRKWDISDEFLDIKNYYNEVEWDLRIEYGDDIIDEDLKQLNNAEKKFEFIFFKEEIIKELILRISIIDNKGIILKNRVLYYDNKDYPLSKDSQRERFINLFFSSKEKCFAKKIIVNYLEFDSWDFYNAKSRKTLLDLYKAINKTVEKKLWIKDLFYLWKWDNEGKICINN